MIKMKKIYLYCLLPLAAAAFTLFACSDINRPEASEHTGPYLVKGSVSVGEKSGAAPSALLSKSLSSSGARTATTDFLVENVEWSVTARPVAEDKEDKEGKGDTSSEITANITGDTFTFSFTQPGEYEVYARLVKDGNVIAEGVEHLVVKDGSDEELAIAAKPLVNGPGKVDLLINLDTTASEKISRVSVSWLDNERMKEPQNLSTKDNDKTKYLIQVEDMEAGAHRLAISFMDNNGNTLYSCIEMINVYSGFTTNRWYGASPHYYATQEETQFLITEDRITNYGAEIVANTSLALFNYDSGGKRYNYYLANESEAKNVNLENIGISGAREFSCFDADGYLYAIKDSTYYSIFKYKPEAAETQLTNLGKPANVGIMSDMAENRVYGYVFKENSLKIQAYGTAENTDPIQVYLLNYADKDLEVPLVRINKSILYILAHTRELKNDKVDEDGNPVEYYAERNFIITCDLHEENPGTKELTDLDFAMLFPDLVQDDNFAERVKFSDMLYQEDSLYILARDCNYSSYYSDGWNYQASIRSRGALIKVNLLTLEQQAIGLSNNSMKGTTFSLLAYNRKYNSDKDAYEFKPIYVEDNEGNKSQFIITPDRSKNPGSDSTLGQEFFPEIWGPIMESETEFFGPSRFAAVKPKKLVIADDGLAFYTDTDGVLKFKNKNRIVYVDLESFAITGSEATNVSLEDDCTFLGAHGSNFGDTNNAYMGINFYEESGSQYLSTVYGGIPCGDSQ